MNTMDEYWRVLTLERRKEEKLYSSIRDGET